MTHIDLIAHPIRHRIVSALAGRRLSAEQLGELMTDVPQATLYRHISALVAGGLLIVADRKRQRGRAVRLLSLSEGAGMLNRDEIDSASAEQNTALVNAFLTGLMAAYASAVRAPGVQPSDWRLANYHVYLSKTEESELIAKLNAVLSEAGANRPARGRRRRILTIGALPDRDLPVSARKNGRGA